MINVGGIYGGRHYDEPKPSCAHQNCPASAVDEAPVALCQRHLRVAFAYVLERERPDLAERADRLPYWAPEAKPTGWVYFVRIGELVKIGYTTSPKKRFATLQPSEVLHLQPGTMPDERRCHLAFAHLRVEGELFRPEPDLLAFIADLQAKHLAA